jgi:hypothetical protein
MLNAADLFAFWERPTQRPNQSGRLKMGCQHESLFVRWSSGVPSAPLASCMCATRGVTSLKHAGFALLPRDVAMAASAQRPKVGHMIEIVAFAVSIARQGPDVVEFSVKRIKRFAAHRALITVMSQHNKFLALRELLSAEPCGNERRWRWCNPRRSTPHGTLNTVCIEATDYAYWAFPPHVLIIGRSGIGHRRSKAL